MPDRDHRLLRLVGHQPPHSSVLVERQLHEQLRRQHLQLLVKLVEVQLTHKRVHVAALEPWVVPTHADIHESHLNHSILSAQVPDALVDLASRPVATALLIHVLDVQIVQRRLLSLNAQTAERLSQHHHLAEVVHRYLLRLDLVSVLPILILRLRLRLRL